MNKLVVHIVLLEPIHILVIGIPSKRVTQKMASF